jgi:preprotein translocase SecE subunit
MGDRRVLGFTWLAAALCLALVLADLCSWAFAQAGIANAELLGGAFDASTVLALVVTAVVAAASWRMPQVYEFCIEVVQETRKVVWPTRQETRDQTLVVVVVSILIAMMLWGFDQVWKRLFAVILNMGA